MMCYLHVSIFDDIPRRDVQGGIDTVISIRTTDGTAEKVMIFAWLFREQGTQPRRETSQSYTMVPNSRFNAKRCPLTVPWLREMGNADRKAKAMKCVQ